MDDPAAQWPTEKTRVSIHISISISTLYIVPRTSYDRQKTKKNNNNNNSNITETTNKLWNLLPNTAITDSSLSGRLKSPVETDGGTDYMLQYVRSTYSVFSDLDKLISRVVLSSSTSYSSCALSAGLHINIKGQ